MAKKINKYKTPRSNKRYSTKERKAYWMGVGAGEIFRENKGVDEIPIWKVKDLGPKAVTSYGVGFQKNYKSFK